MYLKVRFLSAATMLSFLYSSGMCASGPSNALAEACKSGDYSTVMALIADTADVNGATNDSLTPLIVSAEAGQFTSVMFLVKNNADVDQPAKGENGITPLLAAIESGDERIVQFLLSKGADINRADRGGQTPLLAASQAGSESIVKLLLDSGAVVETAKPAKQKEKKQQRAGTAANTVSIADSPLLCAVIQGHTAVIKLLLEKGADVNCADTLGRTALMYAVMLGDTELVQVLLNNGADSAVKDRRGRTAADYAMTLPSPAMIFFLVSRGVPAPAGESITRCYGLYRCAGPAAAFGTQPHYLWFLAGGTVHAISTNTDSSQLADIIHTRNSDLATGFWYIRGGYLNFSIKPRDQGVRYFSAPMQKGDLLKGTCNDGVLDAEVRSTEEGAPCTMRYTFVNIPLYCIEGKK